MLESQSKLPMVTPALRSYCERVEYSLTYLSFATFNAPYNPMRFMYETSVGSTQFFILLFKSGASLPVSISIFIKSHSRHNLHKNLPQQGFYTQTTG